MNATCSSFDTEVLSAYLDDELRSPEVTEVETHLEHCVQCRTRLEGLGRVSSSLKALDRVAPPPILEELVLGQLEVGAARSWTRRLDDLTASSQRTRATVGPMFALVMMLALLVFLFGEALERRSQQSTVISLPSLPPPTLVATTSGQNFVEVGGPPWADFMRRTTATRVFVEESVAEHYALSHGPGAAAAMMLVSELPECSAASATEREQLAELQSSASESLSGEKPMVVGVVRDVSEVRCLWF